MSTPEVDQGPLPSPFAGRRNELATVTGALARARQERHAQVAEVIGDPGMGKTRLLAEAAWRARDDGWLVVCGQPAEFRSSLPLAPLVDALDDHLNAVDLSPLEQTHPGSLALLSTVFPSVPEPRTPSSRPIEEYRLLRAIRALLSLLAEASGLMLVLDDLHRCDTLTAAVLGYLLRHPPHAAVLIAVAYRPGRADPRLVRELATAAQRSTAHRIVLSPLTCDEAQPLLDPGMMHWQRDLTYRKSHGNPAYLEVLSAAARHGRGPHVLPPLSTAPLLAEFEALSSVGRVVAHAAAVAGPGFDPQLLAEVAQVGEADVLGAIDEMLQNDLIQTLDISQQFQFRHPLLRQVAYQQASGGWRLGAHSRAAAVLSRRRAPQVELARHLEFAAAPGDATSSRILLDAARQVLSQRPGQAADWLTAALRLLGEHAEVRERRLEVLDVLSVALLRSGRLTEARQSLTELLGAPDMPERVTVTLRAAEVDLLLGRMNSARRRLRAELAAVGERQPDATRLRLRLCTVALHDSTVDPSLAEDLVSVPAGLTSPVTQAGAATVLAATRLAYGRPDAEEPADLAAELIDAADDSELVGNLWALIWLSTAEVQLERYERGREHAIRGYAVARDSGQLHLAPYLLALIAQAHLSQGRLGAAAEVAGQLELSLGSIGQPGVLRIRHILLQSRIAAAAGDPAASTLAYRAAELAGRTGGQPARLARAALGHALLNEGHPERAASMLLEAGEGPDLLALPAPYRLGVYADLTRADLARGNLTAARQWAERAQHLAGEAQPGHVGIAELATARLLLCDDPGAAASHARHAADLAFKAGQRLDAGQALLVAAAAEAAAGREDAAREADEEAMAVLAECGAENLAAVLREENGPRPQARVQTQTAAVKPPAEQVAEFTALSGRELQIAELVSHGHTNRQIARLLTLSHKTVETYLARIFTKLGVSSRSSVATLVGCGALGGADNGNGEPCTGRECLTTGL
ncbi:helix-turn-helix transcriptional regulator [Paractinoplanes rhizophilus]|uniref:Helix-turn-helix transcriptional regulator n=1 Tax=Paractinoplanes rhizophilus TaxID=1416877 RepID=A0ABW2HZW6_9ACTN